MAEAEKRIREKVEAEAESRNRALDERESAIKAREAAVEKREAGIEEAYQMMEQKLMAEANRMMEAARREALKNSICKIAEQFEAFAKCFVGIAHGNPAETQALIADYRQKAAETQDVLNEEIKKKLEIAAQKGIDKSNHIANLVRMLFTQKRERFVVTADEKRSLFELMLSSVALTPEEKADFLQVKDKVDAYKERIEAARVLRRNAEKASHGRNPVPPELPRLPEIVIYPDEYYGHEDEYRILPGDDVQELIIPVSVKYMVQPYRRKTVVRKNDIFNHPITAPAMEGPIWKSHASAELLAQIEVRKYVFHMPFNRQIRKMSMDGLSLARSTINDWHAAVCDKLRPLYELQKQRVMQSMYLAVDGSPMRVVNKLKHKTVSLYVICYRALPIGIPIFLVTLNCKSGRSKEVIMGQLDPWIGMALLCDAYSGYDWIAKVGKILCRCVAHARRDMERAQKENPEKAKIGLLMYQQVYAVEDIIKRENLTGDAIVRMRNEMARPIWETFRKWAMQEILNCDKNSLMHKSLGYLLNHYDELTAYLDIADMPIDNNGTESALRALVMGRKSYLFCQTEEACELAAIMYSLLGACIVMKKNPERWLADVLKRIDTVAPEDRHTLLPEEWEDPSGEVYEIAMKHLQQLAAMTPLSAPEILE